MEANSARAAKRMKDMSTELDTKTETIDELMQMMEDTMTVTEMQAEVEKLEASHRALQVHCENKVEGLAANLEAVSRR